MTRRLMSCALAGLILVGSSPARAAEPIIIAPARTQGELADPARDQLESSLREVVRKSEVELLEVSDELGRRAAECEDEDDRCRAELIAEANASFLLVPEITLDDQDYRLRLTLYAADGAKSARLEETCSLCGLAEAADLIADLGARIGRKVDVATRASSVAVRSEPAGARIFVGDELVGITPLELPLDPGVHMLRLELDGYIGLGRELEVVAGESTTLELGLQPLPVVAEPEQDRSKTFAGLGWAALALGVGTAAGGATLMALDQRPITSDCSGTNLDAEGHCRWRYATLEGGIGLVVGGAVLVATGVALLVVGRKRSKSSASAKIRVRASGSGWRF